MRFLLLLQLSLALTACSPLRVPYQLADGSRGNTVRCGEQTVRLDVETLHFPGNRHALYVRLYPESGTSEVANLSSRQFSYEALPEATDVAARQHVFQAPGKLKFKELRRLLDVEELSFSLVQAGRVCRTVVMVPRASSFHAESPSRVKKVEQSNPG